MTHHLVSAPRNHSVHRRPVHHAKDTLPPAVITTQLAEVSAVQHYLMETLELQLLEPQVHEEPAGEEIVHRTLEILRKHVPVLDATISALPDGRRALQTAVSDISGLFFSCLSKRRPRDLPAMLRNDFALLSLTTMNYAMLGASALAVEARDIVHLAQNHQRELEEILHEIVHLMPSCAKKHLLRNFPVVIDRPKSVDGEPHAAWRHAHAGSAA